VPSSNAFRFSLNLPFDTHKVRLFSLVEKNTEYNQRQAVLRLLILGKKAFQTLVSILMLTDHKRSKYGIHHAENNVRCIRRNRPEKVIVSVHRKKQ
jgi:hypothetical protein